MWGFRKPQRSHPEVSANPPEKANCSSNLKPSHQFKAATWINGVPLRRFFTTELTTSFSTLFSETAKPQWKGRTTPETSKNSNGLKMGLNLVFHWMKVCVQTWVISTCYPPTGGGGKRFNYWNPVSEIIPY